MVKLTGQKEYYFIQKLDSKGISKTPLRFKKASLETILNAWNKCKNDDLEHLVEFQSAWTVIKARITQRKNTWSLFSFFYWLTGKNKKIDSLDRKAQEVTNQLKEKEILAKNASMGKEQLAKNIEFVKKNFKLSTSELDAENLLNQESSTDLSKVDYKLVFNEDEQTFLCVLKIAGEFETFELDLTANDIGKSINLQIMSKWVEKGAQHYKKMAEDSLKKLNECEVLQGSKFYSENSNKAYEEIGNPLTPLFDYRVYANRSMNYAEIVIKTDHMKPLVFLLFPQSLYLKKLMNK